MEARDDPFTNEGLVGEALAPLRGQVVIATRFGVKLDPHGVQERQTSWDTSAARLMHTEGRSEDDS